MTIAKGRPWGTPGALPPDGRVARTDAEAAALFVEDRGRPIGLLGGDLCRTLGGRGDDGRLRSSEAMTFPVDAGRVVIDGVERWFVAHVVGGSIRRRRWAAVMNAAWLGGSNLAPRAHPNDGWLDVYDASLLLGDIHQVRDRMATGSHLPHPRIAGRRVDSGTLSFERPLPVWADGTLLGRARHLEVFVVADALTVVI